jgi:copper(I)-binding protein
VRTSPTPSALRHTVAITIVALLAAACQNDNPQLSPNRGVDSHTEMTSVLNAYIVPQFVPGHCAIQVGKDGELSFTITNNRTTDPERLLNITTAAADAVHISGNSQPTIEPRSSIAAGQPHTKANKQADLPQRMPPSLHVTLNGLRDSVKPGTVTDVTFQFEKAGSITVPVPVDACPSQGAPQ